jgi:hypothetical protein
VKRWHRFVSTVGCPRFREGLPVARGAVAQHIAVRSAAGRSATITAAVAALGLGGITAAAPLDPLLPGPKQPIEHIGVSGGFFKAESGNPACFSGTGSASSDFPVPRGALLIGATLYVIDSFATGSIGGSLNRHDFATGATFPLAAAVTDGAPGNAVLELKPAQPALLSASQGVHIRVNVGPSTCLKGAEVHFIRNGAAAVADPAAETAATVIPQQEDGRAPDGGLSH